MQLIWRKTYTDNDLLVLTETWIIANQSQMPQISLEIEGRHGVGLVCPTSA